MKGTVFWYEEQFRPLYKQIKISKAGPFCSDTVPSISLDDLIGDVGKTFQEVLFEKIALSGMTDVEVYKRANPDKPYFDLDGVYILAYMSVKESFAYRRRRFGMGKPKLSFTDGQAVKGNKSDTAIQERRRMR